MKKVLGAMSKFIAAGFSIAVLALLMSLTYGALQRIFPDSFSNQMWGLVMFDIAAMCWALMFVFQSKSVGQYAASGIGFIVAFLGTLGMVAAEVMLSGANLAQVDTAQIGKWMIYGFIGVTAIHALLVYVHHGTAPEISEQINVGVARGEITSEAIRQATAVLEIEKTRLAETIHREIVDQVKRDLNIPILADPRMPFLPAREQPYLRTERAAAPPSLLTRIRSKFKRQPPPSPVTYEQTAPAVEQKDPTSHPRHKQPEDRAGYPDNYGPQWKASTNITPTLDEYAWVCLHCEGTNPAFSRSCQWCAKPRTNGSPVTAFSNIPAPIASKTNTPERAAQEDAGAPDAPFQSGE